MPFVGSVHAEIRLEQLLQDAPYETIGDLLPDTRNRRSTHLPLISRARNAGLGDDGLRSPYSVDLFTSL